MWVVCVLCLPHLVVDLLWSLRGMVITDKQEEDHHECRDQTQTHTHTHTHSHTHTLGCKSSLMVPSPAVSSLKCARRPLSSSWSLISSLSHFFPGLHPPSTHYITHSSYVTLLHSLLMSVLCSTYWLWIRAHHQHTVRNTASAVQLLYLCVLCVCVCVCVFGGGWLSFNEWLPGRTGGVREEFVNYEWSTSLWMWTTHSEGMCTCVLCHLWVYGYVVSLYSLKHSSSRFL